MSRWNTARSFVVIAVVNFALTATAFLYITHSASVSKAREQQQGRVVEHKLCTTLDKLAKRKPPGGNPAANPSRAYLQWLHDTLAQLGPDVACTGANVNDHP